MGEEGTDESGDGLYIEKEEAVQRWELAEACFLVLLVGGHDELFGDKEASVGARNVLST